MTIDPNEPAYPVPNDANVNGQTGLTVRAHFAIELAKGLLSQHMTQECESGNRDFEPTYRGGSDEKQGKMVKRAVKIADLLIAELNRPQEPTP